MLMKYETFIIIDVKDDDEAEQAGTALDQGLERMLVQAGFPHGEVVDASVDTASAVSDKEAEENGWVEI